MRCREEALHDVGRGVRGGVLEEEVDGFNFRRVGLSSGWGQMGVI